MTLGRDREDGRTVAVGGKDGVEFVVVVVVVVVGRVAVVVVLVVVVVVVVAGGGLVQAGALALVLAVGWQCVGRRLTAKKPRQPRATVGAVARHRRGRKRLLNSHGGHEASFFFWGEGGRGGKEGSE